MTEQPFDLGDLRAPLRPELGELETMPAQLFSRPRPKGELQAFRERCRPWKKLADEVAAVSNY